MPRMRLVLFLLTAIFVTVFGYFAIRIARGDRFDSKTLTLRPSGIFVVNSVPDGAEIWVNGKLEAATDENLSLSPGEYDIELKKEGYQVWKKKIVIKKEEVTQVNVHLFPAAPSLSPLTFTGAQSPVTSMDNTKLAYGVPASEKADPEKVGVWVMDLADLPIGFAREPREVLDIDPTGFTWRWSPDGRNLLLTGEDGFFLIETNTLTPQASLVPLTATRHADVLATWIEEEEEKSQSNLDNVPTKLRDLWQVEKVVFSPDEDKVMYTATADFELPEGLVSPLPGSSTQTQSRQVKKGNTYIYDLKEDRNFLIYDKAYITDVDKFQEASASAVRKPQSPTTQRNPKPTAAPTLPSTSIHWLGTSNHVVIAEQEKITIVDYDSTNPQVVYAGPYQAPYAIPYPNNSRLLILTNLGAGTTIANLYAVSLR